jgi:hypothetical protein
VNRADNTSTVSTTSGLSGGIRIPKIAMSANTMIAAVLDISNPLPGSDDQK